MRGNITLTYLSVARFFFNRGSRAASVLCSTVPLLVVLSSLLDTPPYFHSHTGQTFQRERPFPLSKTEAPFYLGLVVPSLCPNKILGMRPTHGQRTHVNPHEKTSLVNCSLSPNPLSVLQFLINSWCHVLGK